MVTHSSQQARRRAMRNGWKRLAFLALAVAILLVGIDWFGNGPTRAWLRGTGQLTVTTEPAGAEVRVDGAFQGRTPLTVHITPGPFTLLLRHPYHPPHVEHLTLAHDERAERNVTLAPAHGALLVASNPKGAQVTVNGVAQGGVTPLVIDPIAAGMHTIIVQLEGRGPGQVTAEVLPGARVEASVELERIR